MSSDANQNWLSPCIYSSHTGPQHAMVALHVSTPGQAEPGCQLACWQMDPVLWLRLLPLRAHLCAPGERLRRAPRPHGWATWNSAHRVPRVTDITPRPHLFLALAHGKELEAVSAKATSLGQFHEVTGRLRAGAQDEHNGGTGVALLKDGIKADHGGLHVPVGRCAGGLGGARLGLDQVGSGQSQPHAVPRAPLEMTPEHHRCAPNKQTNKQEMHLQRYYK